ncbi:choice-of-anchor D domain-containing protein [Flexithrix dorotheae]|uniref:choice-of-anchor D domain-containing protein n=1 Tax=Flexithrix dorotheae TaxID=70993 RepID=UPI0003812A21|nr:choice-of-anchor D domain-containing protein [Flexithrix dorotheae]
MDNKTLKNSITIFWLIIFLFSFTISAFSQQRKGLFYTEEEISIWRERAGISPGKTLYKTKGDVSQNSPGDWDRILSDAVTAITSPGNDRFNNYDTHSPIAELWNSKCCGPSNSGRPIYGDSRKDVVDDKEPRPHTNGDHSANSVMHAGFTHLLLGDKGTLTVGGKSYTGKDFANAVRKELLHYSSDKYLDFSNRSRWVVGPKGFADRNPGFFIAEWCSKMLFAYDYTKYSEVYSSAEKAKIENWIKNAAIFFDAVYNTNLDEAFDGGRKYNNYGSVSNSNLHKYANHTYDNGEPIYYFSTNYNNRRSAQFRFSFLVGLFLNEKYLIDNGVKVFKEWIVFGTFKDGSHADMYRGGGGSRVNTGINYTSACVDHAISMADAYARKYDNSLYDYETNETELQKFFPDSQKGKPWYKNLAVNGKSLKNVINSFVRYFDQSYGNSRTWGGVKISTSSKAYDTWVSQANIYYYGKDPEWAKNVKSIYTRQKSGTIAYPSNPTNGSFNGWGGCAYAYPSKLFLFGQMEGKVWPYNDGTPQPPVEETPETPETEDPIPPLVEVKGRFEAESDFSVVTNIGANGEVKISDDLSGLLSGQKAVQIFDKGDKVKINFQIDKTDTYQIKVRLRSGSKLNPSSYFYNGYKFLLNGVPVDFEGDLSSLSNQDNKFGVAYWGTMNSEELKLEEGNNSLEVEALFAWGLVDYLEVFGKESEKIEKIISLSGDLNFGEIEIGKSVRKTFTIENTGTHSLKVTDIFSELKGIKFQNWSGSIHPQESTSIEVEFIPEEEIEYSGKIIVKSDKTSGENEMVISGKGLKPEEEHYYSMVFEAEDNYMISTDVGSKGDIKISDDTSSLLGGGKAVQVFDKGDKVRINFNIPEDGEYQVKVRVRSGNRVDKTSYWPIGYNITLNGNSTKFIGDLESISNEDNNFGIAYWGTMSTDWVSLKKGNNYIELQSLDYWQLVDYVEIVGKGKEKVSIVMQDKLDFGETEIEKSVKQLLTIENNGNATLKIEKLLFSNPAFSGNWSGEILPGQTKEVEVLFIPQSEGKLEAELQVLSNKTEGNATIKLLGIGTPQEDLYLYIEAEDAFELVTNSGTKGEVKETSEESSFLSKSKAVQLYDVEDELKIPFEIPKDGQYLIRVRLRSGDISNSMIYFQKGYEFKVNGETKLFVGDQSSVSELDNNFGKSYWGTMESEALSLSGGKHQLNIKSKLNWALVDYIEVIDVNSVAKRGANSFGDSSSIYAESLEETINATVFPNPAVDFVNFDVEILNSEGASWKILNASGEQVYSKELSEGTFSISVNMKEYGPGLYFSVFISKNTKTVKRFILE